MGANGGTTSVSHSTKHRLAMAPARAAIGSGITSKDVTTARHPMPQAMANLSGLQVPLTVEPKNGAASQRSPLQKWSARCDAQEIFG